MCRLFAMSGGAGSVNADLWLLDAPDSLVAQSHRNPDGTGLGIYDDAGGAVVHKAPIAAFSDAEFAREARHECSRTFLAHVRFASTGALTLANTHPFLQDGRLFAHNGVLAGLELIEQELGEDSRLIEGQTDSERLFALITHEIRRAGGDVRAGIVSAVKWVARNVPVYSLNLIITTQSEVFALRYPEHNELFVLDRAAGGEGGEEALLHRSSLGMRVHSADARRQRVVVLASEPMDEDSGWRALRPGELLHVTEMLEIDSEVVLPDAPAHPLDLATLGRHARSSQST